MCSLPNKHLGVFPNGSSTPILRPETPSTAVTSDPGTPVPSTYSLSRPQTPFMEGSDELPYRQPPLIPIISNLPTTLGQDDMNAGEVDINVEKDRDKVLEAVKKNGLALEFAPEELKGDREVVLEAVKQYGRDLEFASDNLKEDRGVVMTAVIQDGLALEFAAEALKADREIVMEALKKNGLALEFASIELKGDEELVRLAVTQDVKVAVMPDGWVAEMKEERALKFASEAMRADKDIGPVAK
jgi:hypothetical protein